MRFSLSAPHPPLSTHIQIETMYLWTNYVIFFQTFRNHSQKGNFFRLFSCFIIFLLNDKLLLFKNDSRVGEKRGKEMDTKRSLKRTNSVPLFRNRFSLKICNLILQKQRHSNGCLFLNLTNNSSRFIASCFPVVNLYNKVWWIVESLKSAFEDLVKLTSYN